MKKIGLDIDELTSPEIGRILNRAQERLEKAVSYISIGQRFKNAVKFSSFRVAIMLTLATQNSFIKNAALAEAKQAFSALQFEPREKIVAIARNFDWNIGQNKESQIPTEFALVFTDYLRKITHLRDEKWKLVNRLLVNGKVYLGRHLSHVGRFTLASFLVAVGLPSEKVAEVSGFL
jgi:DNA primase large subunit